MSRSSKLAFVTGAGGGIGQATVRRFAEAGWRVAVSDIRREGLDALAADLGPTIAAALVLDVSDATAVETAIASIARDNDGRLDLLVNNAGLGYDDPFEEKPLAFHHALEAVNIRGVLNCTYLAFPYLKAAAGRVVSLGSISAIYGAPSAATYSASKFWIRGFTEALNIEWESHGIHVCDVMPAFVATAMIENLRGIMIDRFGVHLSPEDVAAAVFRAAHERRVHRIIDKRVASRLRLGLLDVLPTALKRIAIRRIAAAP